MRTYKRVRCPQCGKSVHMWDMKDEICIDCEIDNLDNEDYRIMEEEDEQD